MTSIRQIRVQQWALYTDEQKLSLPETGLVVISGANGEGKSTLVEAVSFALWNKSIRDKGKGCWRNVKEPSRVAVTLADGSEICREYARGSSPRVTISEGGKPSRYGTATKAQGEIDTRVGEFSMWRTACVFHAGSEAARFASATDSERKRLIDALMGVDMFDAASKAARADLRAAESKHDAAQRSAELLRTKAEMLTTRMQDARTSLAAICDPPEPADVHVDASELPELQARLTSCEKAQSEISARIRAVTDDLGGIRQRRGALGEQLRSFDLRAGLLGGQATCPTCLAPVDGSARSRALAGRGDVEHELGDVEQRAAVAATELAELREKSTQLAQEDQRLSRQIADARAAATQAARSREAWEHARARAAAERERVSKHLLALGTELAKLDETLDDRIFELEEQAAAVAELRAADRALGVTGIRATVAGDLLGSIEQLANYWMGLIDERLGVKLSAFRELANGSQRDEIELRLTGAGGDDGSYHNASTGQQRRVDLAVMLALAEVVGGDTTRQRSTLFFDEVFGALDVNACRSTARVLRELAAEHCVVVLTHVEQLAEDLGADVHVRVSNGKVVQVKS